MLNLRLSAEWHVRGVAVFGRALKSWAFFRPRKQLLCSLFLLLGSAVPNAVVAQTSIPTGKPSYRCQIKASASQNLVGAISIHHRVKNREVLGAVNWNYTKLT